MLKQLILAKQGVIHGFKLSNKIIDGWGYLTSVVVDRSLILASLLFGIDRHGAKPSMCGTGDEAELGQLVLVLPFGLIIARGGRSAVIIRVIIEVTEGGEEGALLGLGLLEVHLLEHLLVESSLQFVLTRGVLALVLVLAGVVLVGEVLVLLGVVGDKVVGISTAIATILWTTTVSMVHVVVVKP